MTEESKNAMIDRIDDAMGESPIAGDPLLHPGLNFDPKKLQSAWDVMSEALKETVRAVAKNEIDNAATRGNAKRATWAVMLSVLVGIAAGYKYTADNHAILTEMRDRQATMREDLTATLKAVRAVSEALGAKIEADSAMHPVAEEAARQKAVEAQEAALEAEVVVADSPVASAEAVAKLAEVRLRQKVVADSPVVKAVGAGPGGEADPEDDVALEDGKDAGP